MEVSFNIEVSHILVFALKHSYAYNRLKYFMHGVYVGCKSRRVLNKCSKRLKGLSFPYRRWNITFSLDFKTLFTLLHCKLCLSMRQIQSQCRKWWLTLFHLLGGLFTPNIYYRMTGFTSDERWVTNTVYLTLKWKNS